MLSLKKTSILLLILFFTAALQASNHKYWYSPDAEEIPTIKPHLWPVKFLIGFYQVVISPQDEPACVFSLSCSEYAKRAIEEFGFFKGVVMGADRLTRCNSSAHQFFKRDSRGKLIDPLPVKKKDP